MKIPKQLQDKKFRFIKVDHNEKKPIEEDWTMSNNYKYDEPEFQEYLKKAKAYGIACGYGKLAVIDCDVKHTREHISKIKQSLPPTFEVKTGSGGLHMYYIINDMSKKIVMDKGETHYGEVQFTGSQAICPGSLHPTGTFYEIVNDKPIANITKEQLIEVIEEFIGTDDKAGLPENPPKFDIGPVANTIKGLVNKGYKLVGPHPTHSSDSGKNFEIDLEKNLWHCFRDNTGGDVVTLVAMLEGIIDCRDCKKGALLGDDYYNTLQLMKDKYGYDIDLDETELLEKYKVFSKKGRKGNIRYKYLADLIRKEYSDYNFTVVADDSTKKADIYRYRDGVYVDDGELIITKLADHFLQERACEKADTEVLHSIKKHAKRVNRNDFSPPANLINVKNGILDIDTMTLIPHDKKYYFLSQIPVNYNPQAKCPEIQKFLKSTFRKNSEKIKTIQELFGYCLYRDYKIGKVFILYGAGENGKTTLLNLLERLIGKDNCAFRPLKDILHDKFAPADLYGKHLNLSGEMNYRDLDDTSMFKMATGEDTLTAERKYKDPFNFRNYAKLIFNTNRIAYTFDPSVGFYRRIAIIKFFERFTAGDPNTDVDIKSKITTNEELEGCLLWAIKGLNRLLKQGYFSGLGTTNEIAKEYEELVNFEREFIEDSIDESYIGDSKVSLNELYEIYLKECKKYNYPPKTKEYLSRLVPKVKSSVKVKRKRGSGGVRYTYFERCSLNNEAR